jgi:hypothetical protein
MTPTSAVDTITATTIITTTNIIVTTTTGFSLDYVLNSANFNQSITGRGVDYGYCGFCVSNTTPKLYFVANYNEDSIMVFDKNWYFVGEVFGFYKPCYIIAVEDYLLITGDKYVWKTDMNLNYLIQYTSNDAILKFRGLYHYSQDNSLYIVSYVMKNIQIFDLDLGMSGGYISVSPYKPWSINGIDDKIYVGTSVGVLLLVDQAGIAYIFNACDGQMVLILSILIDKFDHMTTSCQNNHLYLYDMNGNYLFQNMLLDSSGYDIGYDSLSRFVIVEEDGIYLYTMP